MERKTPFFTIPVKPDVLGALRALGKVFGTTYSETLGIVLKDYLNRNDGDEVLRKNCTAYFEAAKKSLTPSVEAD